MALLLRLEDFDASTEGQSEPHGANATAQPGYEAGFAAGQAAAMDAQQKIDAGLVQTLSDMAFGFAEARQHTMTGLAPLFQALIDQLIPDIVEQSFRARLLETLLDLAKAPLTSPVRLIVHPDQISAVSALIPLVKGIEIDLHHDPELGANGALISHSSGECMLDLDVLTAQMRSILESLFDITTPSQELPQHG